MFVLRLIPSITGHRSECFCNGMILASQIMFWMLVIMTIETYMSDDWSHWWTCASGTVVMLDLMFLCTLLNALDDACTRCKKKKD